MKIDLKPDTPRPLSRTGAMVAPGCDARWRALGPHAVRANRLTAHRELRHQAQVIALAKVGR